MDKRFKALKESSKLKESSENKKRLHSLEEIRKYLDQDVDVYIDKIGPFGEGTAKVIDTTINHRTAMVGPETLEECDCSSEEEFFEEFGGDEAIVTNKHMGQCDCNFRILDSVGVEDFDIYVKDTAGLRESTSTPKERQVRFREAKENLQKAMREGRKPDYYNEYDKHCGGDKLKFTPRSLEKILSGKRVTDAQLLTWDAKCWASIQEAEIENEGYLMISHGHCKIQFDVQEVTKAKIDWFNQYLILETPKNILRLWFYRMPKEDFEKMIEEIEE